MIERNQRQKNKQEKKISPESVVWFPKSKIGKTEKILIKDNWRREENQCCFGDDDKHCERM